MFLVEVETAEREAAVIPAATVPSVGKQDVFVLVVANPVSTALRPGQVLRRPAQAAPRNWLRAGWLCCLRFGRFAGSLLWHGFILNPDARIEQPSSLDLATLPR
jgi:hypothetical protein